jgi:probable HAF family extracellular repeat protein
MSRMAAALLQPGDVRRDVILPLGLNNQGDVVGSVSGPDKASAFLYRRGKIVNLSRRGEEWSEATGINDRGQVIGAAPYPDRNGPSRACLWERGRRRFLPMLRDSSEAAPKAVNHRGQVVGTVQTRRFRAVLWEKGRIRNVSPSHEDAQALDINDQGQIVGTAVGSRGRGQAFLCSQGKTRFLAGAAAVGINNQGQIAIGKGQFKTQPRAFLMTPPG